MGKYSDFPSQTPDQNLQFTPQSKTTSIPVTRYVYNGVPPGLNDLNCGLQWCRQLPAVCFFAPIFKLNGLEAGSLPNYHHAEQKRVMSDDDRLID